MKPALAAFLEDADLSPQEIDDIQQILDQKRKG
jgi:predicted transcriptional regulator